MIESIINIFRTILVCFLLAGSSFYFNKDTSNLVVLPIERMMERIKIIQKNPMKLCSDDATDGMGILELELLKKQEKQKNKKKKKHKATYETEILETSLTKIGRLLGLCFGEAGA